MNSAPETDPRSPAGRRLPWRSATAGWLATAGLVVAGLPLFLRMPLWVDVTLYDVAARTVLAGGTHYRDVFDTNPPGFVWALCLIRVALGPGTEALRAVDLGVVAAVTVLLLRLSRTGGATAAGVAWAAAGVVGFYLFLSEFNHCQRDVWMMLPAAAAVTYRCQRVRSSQVAPTTAGWVFRTAALEGAVWGLAAWIKPHIILVAAAAWAVTQARLAGAAPAARGAAARRSAADLAGSFAGGLLVGGAGVAWLVGSGTWPHLYEVVTKWSTPYLSQILSDFDTRWAVQLGYFPPWSLLFVAAAPLAVLNLLDAPGRAARPVGPGPVGRRLPGWLYAAAADADQRFARGVLAAVYLAWAAVALGFQKPYNYVHVPETLLMIALFAANRWAIVFPVLCLEVGVMGWLAAAGTTVPRWEDQPVVVRHLVWQYPDGEPNRFRWWPACFAPAASGDLRNGVAFQAHIHAGVDWRELEEVAAFLRSQGVTAGDARVMCWHDSPHALYLTMGLRPPIRFMHLSTAVGMGPGAYERVRDEVTAAAPGVRFVVSDLRRVELFFPPEAKARMAECGPDLLPPVVPKGCRAVFPLNQPAVFRSGDGRGRYLVHVLTRPVGEVYVAGWPEHEGD